MPIFNFKCDTCGKVEEKLVSSQVIKSYCPCLGLDHKGNQQYSVMFKLVSAPRSFILKGKGFYKPTCH